MSTNEPRVLGALHVVDGRGETSVQDRFATGPDDLWDALTRPERLARWLGEVEGDLRLHGRFRARFHASGWEGEGTVEVCEPPYRLRVSTTEDGGSEPHLMEATLSAEGDGTLLVIRESGIPLDQLSAYGAGLQVHLEDLTAVLAGGGRCDAQTRWGELHPGYQRLAAAVGDDPTR